MSRNASAFSLSFLLMLSLMLPFAAAQEDFSASSQPSYTLCPCSGQGYPVTVTNTGTTASTYTLSANDAAKEWVTLSPSSFSLNAKQSAKASVFVNSPCAQHQAIPISLVITTKNGLAKALTTNIQFNPSCYGFSLTQGTLVDSANTPSITFASHEGSYSLCALDTKAIPILVRNLDANLDNSYTFSVNGPATLPVPQFGLKKGGNAVLMVEVSPQAAGTSEIVLKATSEKGQLTAEKKLVLDAEDCYSISVDIAEEKIQLCGGDTAQVAVRVSNSGSFRENISLSVEGAPWATSDVDSVSLGANRFSGRSIYLSPPADTKGTFPLSFKADLLKQAVSAQDSFVVGVEPSSACYSSEISAKGKLISGEEYLPIVVRNTGSRQQAFSAWIENIDWGRLSEESVTLNAGDERHLTLHLFPNENVTSGTYAIAIGIASPNQNTKKEITINYAPDTPTTKAIKGFFFTYRHYLYALVALLIILFFLRNPLLKAYRKHRRISGLRKARQEAAKAKRLEREAKLAKKAKKELSQDDEGQPWTVRQWASAGIVAIALILGVCFALFPAAVKAFFVNYGLAIAAILIIGLVVLFAARKLIKKKRRRK